MYIMQYNVSSNTDMTNAENTFLFYKTFLSEKKRLSSPNKDVKQM